MPTKGITQSSTLFLSFFSFLHHCTFFLLFSMQHKSNKSRLLCGTMWYKICDDDDDAAVVAAAARSDDDDDRENRL